MWQGKRNSIIRHTLPRTGCPSRGNLVKRASTRCTSSRNSLPHPCLSALESSIVSSSSRRAAGWNIARVISLCFSVPQTPLPQEYQQQSPMPSLHRDVLPPAPTLLPRSDPIAEVFARLRISRPSNSSWACCGSFRTSASICSRVIGIVHLLLACLELSVHQVFYGPSPSRTA